MQNGLSSNAQHMRAQASLEQLIVLGLALVFVSIAFYIASSYSSDSVKISQSEDAVNRLAAGVDYVYSLGPNSKEYVTVYLPQDLESANVSGKRILLRVQTSAGISDIFANTKADLVGALPVYRGKQKILISYLANGRVSIGEAGLSCSPQFITRTFNASGNGSDVITVTNDAQFEVVGINATFTGSASSLTSMSQPSPSSLLPNEGATITLNYNIPPGQPSGIYTGVIDVQSANDGSCVSQLTLHISGTSTCPALCASQGYSRGTCRASPSACVSSGDDSIPSFDYSCSQPTPSCCCGPTSDLLGPLVTSISSFPLNASASQAITLNATCDDTTTGGSYILRSELQLDGGAWSSMAADDGSFSDQVIQGVSRNVGNLIAGQHIAAVRCTDTANNTGPISFYYLNITMADIVGPIVVSMNHTDFPTTLTNVTENAVATELYTGNADILECQLRLDGGAWGFVPADDGSYDSPTESFTKNFGTLTAGTHTVYAYCVDALGNIGGTYNDTFGVTSVDVMLVIDKSGSMAEPVTNAVNNNAVSTTSSSFTLVKSASVTVKNGDPANISTELHTSGAGCNTSFEARIGSSVIANGSTTSTSYVSVLKSASLAGYTPPFSVDLYLKRTGSGCTAYNRNFNVTQLPSKMSAAQTAANTFVDIIGNSTKAGMVSYSTTATTNMQLTMMDSIANKNSLKSSINSLVSSGNTCIECGLDNGVAELISSRGRYPNSTRVIILLTDGQGNVGDSVAGAVYARDNNAVVYTIGFGDSVDDTELTNIALLTHGQYYFAPDAATLLYIYQHIGQ